MIGHPFEILGKDDLALIAAPAAVLEVVRINGEIVADLIAISIVQEFKQVLFDVVF